LKSIEFNLETLHKVNANLKYCYYSAKMIRNLVRSKRDVLSLILTSGYLLLLGLAASGIGVMLDIYNASSLIWLITLGITVHLAWAGTGAIALAMVWVLILIWVAVVIYATPNQVQLDPPTWAISLIKLWVQGVLYVVLSGFAPRLFARWGLKQTQVFLILLILVWSALGTGTLIYP
jgi:hypothetical protein